MDTLISALPAVIMHRCDKESPTQYERDGYVIVSRVLDPALLAAMQAEAARLCPDGNLCLHFPHKLSLLVRDVVRHRAVVEVLTRVIGPNVKMMQSMLFIKGPGKPGQAWHQDEAHIPTRDRSLTGVWIALDDATVENGCLWVLPGSHRPGVLYPTRSHADPRFDPTPEAYGFGHPNGDAVPVELAAGSAVVFNGYLLHRSFPNRHPSMRRRALVNHYMSAESLLPWMPPGDGETMATADCRDVMLVAGTDPHASKGVADVMQPYLRADAG